VEPEGSGDIVKVPQTKCEYRYAGNYITPPRKDNRKMMAAGFNKVWLPNFIKTCTGQRISPVLSGHSMNESPVGTKEVVRLTAAAVSLILCEAVK
jgi:hypothetical protein